MHYVLCIPTLVCPFGPFPQFLVDYPLDSSEMDEIRRVEKVKSACCKTSALVDTHFVGSRDQRKYDVMYCVGVGANKTFLAFDVQVWESQRHSAENFIKNFVAIRNCGVYKHIP